MRPRQRVALGHTISFGLFSSLLGRSDVLLPEHN